MSPWTKQPRSHTSLHFWGKEQLFACDKWRNRKYNKDSYLINCLSCSFSGQMVATNMQITIWLSVNHNQLYFKVWQWIVEYQSICLVNFDFHFQSAKGFRLMHNASRPIGNGPLSYQWLYHTLYHTHNSVAQRDTTNTVERGYFVRWDLTRLKQAV